MILGFISKENAFYLFGSSSLRLLTVYDFALTETPLRAKRACKNSEPDGS